jgi:DNA helicase-2/ATP-dependent DNA helicase PcrA
MDVSELLDTLNDAQRDAVGAPLGHTLVLAGAGSGKTRVLVHRIAWMLQVENQSPFSIFAVTFTNKAANEMRGRIENLIGFSTQGMWVGTFHGLAHRLLRTHWQEAGLSENFQILDSDDQLRQVRRILAAFNLDEAQWAPKQIQWFINQNKDAGLRPKNIDHHNDMHTKTLIRIYQQYEENCQRSGLVDFAEILLRAHELWLNNPSLLAHYQQRFRHILVDEFQDTNSIQYAWIRLLVGDNGSLMVVGDDDQSIYGWRGAKIENIQRLHKDFPHLQTVRLEQNYRSTGTILAAANALINNNDGRLGKNLWTEDGEGELISLYAGFNDLDEARFITDKISQWIYQGNLRNQVAILYRSNAQSRVLEESLIQSGIPYRIYGGLRFFDRAEIKDALGYLRLVMNHDDDAAYERVINTPPRGLGDQTLTIIRDYARANGVTLWRATQDLITQQGLSSRAINSLALFTDLISDLSHDSETITLGEITVKVLFSSGLFEHYQKEKGEKGQARIENLEELINAAKQYQDDSGADLSPLAAFLSHAALESGENQGEAHEDCVQLMTLHSAKGLEFPLVFLCGMEEGLFPHHLSVEDSFRLEEERRLCYVGMTRAMRKLYITYAERRRLHGSETYHRPSRFIGEIPEKLIQDVRVKTQISRPVSVRRAVSSFVDDVPNEFNLKLGQRVMHPKFGEGVVLSFEGRGDNSRVQVKFADAGAKWLVAAYARLEAV